MRKADAGIRTSTVHGLSIRTVQPATPSSPGVCPCPVAAAPHYKTENSAAPQERASSLTPDSKVLPKQIHPKQRPAMPSRLQPRPIRQGRSLACLLRRQCRCRTYTGSRHRSPWAGPASPSIRLPRCASFRLSSSSPRTVSWAAGAPAHWLDNAVSLYADSQSRGSSGCLSVPEELQQQASGLARLPTREH